MSSNEASFGVTYTSISSNYEEPFDTGSLGVIVYGYDGLPMHPVDPPSPDYIPDPKEPEQAPLSPDYVPRLEYPDYLAPSDAKIPIGDQPHATDASPTALSLGYITSFDPEEDSKDVSEDGPTNYPADRGDDDDDDSSRDDADDEYEEEEEEHLASADSTAVSLAVDLVPSTEETEPFETNESTTTPPPPPAYRTTTRMSIRVHTPIPFPAEAKVVRLLVVPTPPPSPLTPLSSPLSQIPSPPVPVPSPPITSPTYFEAPLGFRAVGIRLRAASPLPSPTSPPTHHPLPLPAPSTSRRADFPEVDIPPQKRLCLTAPTPRFKVGESLA
ncbi:hypothetical protein Tco_0029132, partial [Tanacetum coccineum]